MLEEVGIRLPKYKVRDIVQDLRNKGETEGETLSKAAFEKVRAVQRPGPHWRVVQHTHSGSYLLTTRILEEHVVFKTSTKGPIGSVH
jgi:hypothetical protein